jgi:cell division transport system permease protein
MRFQYLLGQAMTNLRRNGLVVISAVLAVFVTLALVFLAVVLRRVVDENTGRWDDDIRVIAFLTDDLTLEDIDGLQREVISWDEVESVVYFTKAEALEEFRTLFADQPSLIEVVEEDPSTLPASLRIRPTEAADYDAISNRLAVISGVRQVSSADAAIDNMVTLSNILRVGAVAISIFLGGAAVVLIGNTIRMAIYARRDEISIMKLVGAGNWFVRVPFLLEGAIEGLLGGILAVGGVIGMYRWFVPFFDAFPDWIAVDIPVQFLIQSSILVVFFGVAAGLIGSAIGMWGFLKD